MSSVEELSEEQLNEILDEDDLEFEREEAERENESTIGDYENRVTENSYVDDNHYELEEDYYLASSIDEIEPENGNIDESEFKFDNIETSMKESLEESLNKSVSEIDEELGEETGEWLRTVRLEEYMKLLEEKKSLRRKNAFIHRKITEHLKRKKLTKLLQEPANITTIDYRGKYDQTLKSLSQKINWQIRQKRILDSELDQLRKKVDAENEKLQVLFNSLLNKERIISKGLIESRTGKRLSENIISQFISRQQGKMKLIGKIQLACIQIGNQVLAKDTLISKLENVGENLSLIDFEQLQMENVSYIDKIEERDEELNRIRNKSSLSLKILAQIREKSFANTSDIQVMEQKVKLCNTQLNSTREKLNEIKIERDQYRAEKRHLQDISGLLTQNKLLLDYQTTIRDTNRLGQEYIKIKTLFEKDKDELTKIRNALESFGGVDFELFAKLARPSSKQLKIRQKLYQRPTLIPTKSDHKINYHSKYY